MAHWVQHQSGQGEKWEVRADYYSFWECQPTAQHSRVSLHLPKSEYVLCDPPTPPTRWVDVTAECAYRHDFLYHDVPGDSHSITILGEGFSVFPGYRLRKVQLYTSPDGRTIDGEQWAFVVEKEQP